MLPTLSEGVDVTLRLRPVDSYLVCTCATKSALSFKPAISAVLNLPHFWAIFTAHTGQVPVKSSHLTDLLIDPACNAVVLRAPKPEEVIVLAGARRGTSAR